MYSKYAEVLSLMSIMVYYYLKTKDKIISWVFVVLFIYGLLLVPRYPFISPLLQYVIFFIVFIISMCILLVKIAKEIEKRGKESEGDKKSFVTIFKLSRDNIIFWIIIVFINLLAFILDKGK